MEGTHIQNLENTDKPFPLSKLFAAGLGMFSMFFGAGNVIFPLVIGFTAQDQTLYAILGLLITAVAMPFAGLIGIILFNGNYNSFFGRIGRIPGFFLALLLLLLLGPVGSTPRCIALAYSTLKMSLPEISITWFSAVSCVLIFIFAYRKNRVVDLLGWVLTPLLLISLFFIIIKGVLTPSDVGTTEASAVSVFYQGLKEGYNTMDLMAAFFFSSVVLASLRNVVNNESATRNGLFSVALNASLIGAGLLAIVYIGFSFIAAFHAQSLSVSSPEQLLGAIAVKIIGAHAGFIVSVTIALACLTTGIALSAVFADFLQNRVCKGTINYQIALIASLCLTFFVATVEFSGISTYLSPILQVIYPVLIVMTFLNIAYKLVDFQWIKTPVFITFLISLYVNFDEIRNLF